MTLAILIAILSDQKILFFQPLNYEIFGKQLLITDVVLVSIISLGILFLVIILGLIDSLLSSLKSKDKKESGKMATKE